MTMVEIRGIGAWFDERESVTDLHKEEIESVVVENAKCDDRGADLMSNDLSNSA
jgi:hypothetical protein